MLTQQNAVVEKLHSVAALYFRKRLLDSIKLLKELKE